MNDHTGRLTHLDDSGAARMVDVGSKPSTRRRAVAAARLAMQASTVDLLAADDLPKGDVLAVARVAGIQAAKGTAQLIPLCHQIALSSVEVRFTLGHGTVDIEAEVTCEGSTGVEMEALTAVSVAGLTVYDMCKAVDRWMTLGEVRLVEKAGGRGGHLRREGYAVSDPGAPLEDT